MFHYCLLLVLLLIILLKYDKTVEGVQNAQGGTHTTASVKMMSKEKQISELERIRRSNYADAKGFENMMKKGICTDEPDTNKYHSCKINHAIDTKPKINLRYVNLPPDKLNESSEYNYMSNCSDKYKKTMDILVSDNMKPDPKMYKIASTPPIPDPKNFFENKFSRGQYPGYTRNNYLDRTRYVRSEEPLPSNPDFFMDGGGTYA